MATHDVVLCSPVRTAIGAYNGSLKTLPAPELGAAAVRETLRRSGLDAAAIGSVVMGNVIQAGNKMNPARQASIGGVTASAAQAPKPSSRRRSRSRQVRSTQPSRVAWRTWTVRRT
jgi:acetyl-CoA C-acetyltransferase